MSRQNPLVAPVLKWVGGKRQLLDQILPLIPKKVGTYFEPFLGGGAVLFGYAPSKAIVNDSNKELINVYQTIKNNPEALISKLNEHKERNNEEYFYQIRSIDRNETAYSKLSDIERAARIIYLNKTCYNGLFRVNSSGEFNSPWGRYKNPNITCETTIRALNNYLLEKNITILTGGYSKAIDKITKNDFVYFDPPYMPISNSSSFTGYTSSGFGIEEQKKLKALCDYLDSQKIKFLLSNSSCPFIKELYSNYRTKNVEAKRMINSNSEKRGEINEVLIYNYDI